MIEKIYIGTYSNSIKIYEFNSGKMEAISEVNNLDNPSYLHINKNMFYVVNETNSGSVTAFKIKKDGLELVNSQKINQSSLCHITTNKARDSLLIANYGSGSIVLYELKNDGSIGQLKNTKIYNKNSKLHYVKFIENNIYAVDLGNNAIYIYNTNMELISQINMEKGSGPRHFVVSKDNKKIYVVTELSNEIFSYYKSENEFKLLQKISTLTNKNKESFAGAIKISNNNKNIYVTNRGDNSISVFKVNNNKIELIQNISSCGDFPRDILLNNSEEYVIVANQNSSNIVIFKRDIESGFLTSINNANIEIEGPACLISDCYNI